VPKYIFNYFCNVWSSIVVQWLKSLCVLFELLLDVFYSKHDLNRLIVVDNSAIWFGSTHIRQQLIYDAFHIPWQNLASMDVVFYRIIIVDPFFIASYNLIKKLLFVQRKQIQMVQMVKWFWSQFRQFICLLFESFPMCKRSETIDLSIFNAPVNSSSVRVFIQHLQFGISKLF